MEKTSREIAKEHELRCDEGGPNYHTDSSIVAAMEEYAAIKSLEDNKALTASFEAGINSLAYDAKKLQEKLTIEKLKVITLQSDNRALSDMCDKLAARLEIESRFNSDPASIFLLTEYNKLKGEMQK